MKRSTFFPWVFVLAIASISRAQSPDPPEALSRFDPLLGNWKGEGVVRMAPGDDAPVIEWTSVSSVKKVAEGHAVQEDVKIDMKGGPPAPIVLRSVYGWDPHAERFVHLGLSNMGFAGYSPVHWSENGKLIVTSTRVEEGTVSVDHAVSEFSGDTYKFRIEQSRNGGPFFTHVEGSFQKSDETFDAGAADIPALVPPAGEIRKLEPQLGTWKYEGELRLQPGAPAMKVSGKERIRSILGGHVHLSEVEGDEIPGAPKAYRGQFYLAWDPTEKCYQAVGVDNFSGLGRSSQGHILSERRMVYTGSGVSMGVPQAERVVVDIGEDSKRIEVVSNRMAGAHPPDKAFVGVYERVGEAPSP